MRKILITLSAILLLLSCNSEDELGIRTSENNPENSVKKVNGILSFNSKENLKDAIENLNGKERYQIENYFEKLYNNGFKSFRPIINKRNRELINEYMSEFNSQRRNEEDQFLIPDPVFAAYINGENEIIVDNSLYKFTTRGLFFGDLNDSIKIREVALNHNISNRMSICDLRRNESGVTGVGEGVNRYIAAFTRVDDDCERSGGGSGGSGSGSGGSSGSGIDPEIAINNMIQNLSICDGNNTYWFST
ncbi:MAG: hypothetical protein GKR88_06620 [Flavobacteriaceae bacterium]|nr:MAG: hypothetical protein GKR88_06620 [Flavobacteriaceae bacterium]